MSLYKIDENTLIDEYGVCHKDFSLRDEVEYNFMRAKEKEMQQSLLPNSYNNDYFGKMVAEEQVNNQQSMMSNGSNYSFVKPVQNYTAPTPYSWGDIALSGLQGMGQGIVGSLEHSINSNLPKFGGIYDIAHDQFGNNGYERRQKELENLAAQENLQRPLKYLLYFNDAVTGAYAHAKLKPLAQIPKFTKYMFNKMK